MSGVFQSILFSLEDTYAKGKGSNYKWIAPPPGSWVTTTHSRNTQRINAMGCKTYDTYAYGALSGSFEWNFNLDYNYLEFLVLIFDYYEGFQADDDGVITSLKGTVGDGSGSALNTTYHMFKKTNAGRIRSFTMRRRKLNRIRNENADGGNVFDETEEYYGCVVKTVRFSRSAGSSQTQVSVSGFYANEKMILGKWNGTEYQPYEGVLAEYSCMLAGDVEADCEYVANTESLSLSIENNAEAIYQICGPFAKIFCEKGTTNSLNAVNYSNDPRRYATRIYGGGYQRVPNSNANGQMIFTPATKGLKPLPFVKILTYSGEYVEPIVNPPDTDTKKIQYAFNKSDMNIEYDVTGAVFKSLSWTNGNGDKLQDSISAECKDISIIIKNPTVGPNGLMRLDCAFKYGNNCVEVHDENDQDTNIVPCFEPGRQGSPVAPGIVMPEPVIVSQVEPEPENAPDVDPTEDGEE